MVRFVLVLVALLMLAGASREALAQQSYGRIDVRALHTSNVVAYRTADTNVLIGLATWRSVNPRSMIVAQKPVGTNWSALKFQFAVQHDDSVTLILRGRYREGDDTTNSPPEWVWADSVSITDTNGVELCRNGSFERVHGFLGLIRRDGQPEKWGYRDDGREIKSDARFCHEGDHCIRLKHDVAAYHSFRARSNVWYTVTSFFRAE